MSTLLYRQLDLTLEENSSIILSQVDGTTRSLGRVSTNLTICNRTHPVHIHVLNNFHYPLLLGLDIGSKFGLQLDLINRKAAFIVGHH